MPDDSGTIDITPSRRILHLSMIDSEGKPRTDSYDIPAAATDAELNALKAALGATTNASLWQVGVTNWFANAVPSKANADDLTNDSVKDNIAILLKTVSSPDGFDFFIPANNEAVTMVANTENPDPLTTEMIALLAAIEAVWPSYAPISYRFTERKNKNRAIKA